MKKQILLLVCLTLTTFINAQDKKVEKSTADVFYEKSGDLIQKEYISIGSMQGSVNGGFTIEVVQYTNLSTLQKTSTIRFEYGKGKTFGKSGSVDADELDALIKSMKTIQEKILPNSPPNYTEVTFKSRSGFSAGCYYSSAQWNLFIKVTKLDDYSITLNQTEFSELILLLQKAKTKL